MRVALVLGVVGQLLRLFSLAFVPPLLLAFFDGLFPHADWPHHPEAEWWYESAQFAVALVAALGFGTLLARRLPSSTPMFRRAEALAVVFGTWLTIAAFGAVPYLFHGLSPINAIFESVSGFTTTGATILSGTDWLHRPRAFWLWRAMTQWFGGLGVIALFVIVLPRLGIAGRQVFFAEASTAPGEAVSPSVRHTAKRLWIFYVGLTLLQTVLLLVVADLPWFESFVHSLTTLAAGGFSPNPASVMGYDNPAMEWIFIPFMFVAGASYPLMYVACTRNPLVVLRDGEFGLYTIVSLVATAALAFLLVRGFAPSELELRAAAFQVTSLISSAGFASVDYQLWAPGLKILLIFVMIMGGCAGSAAGGVKEVRFLLVLKFLWRELTRVLHPRAVIPIRHKGEAVSGRVMWAVFTLVLLYLVGYAVVAIPVVILGADLETGFAASIACLSNVGPAFGDAGPMGTYDGFPLATKIILTGAMLIGRLEIVTVLALLHPHVWRRLSWSGRRPAAG